MQVDFYHLATTPVEQVLPRIAERILADGGRLLIVSENDALARRIDDRLWSYAPTAFLPHGRAGEGREDAQPVLIAPDPNPANGARHIALADGQWRDAALAFDRTFHFFDSDTIAAARAAWKTLASRDDLTRNFWKQDEAGRWMKQA